MGRLVKFFIIISGLCLSLSGCDKKKSKSDEKPAQDSQTQTPETSDTDKSEKIPIRSDDVAPQQEAIDNHELTVAGEHFSDYYNRATESPYFQASTELQDLFPDLTNPKTSQLCLPTIMSYELYTQLAAKPTMMNSQAESYLMRPVTDQVREMYKLCETDRYRGTTAPQAANCAVKAAYATGLRPNVSVIGPDAKWKAGGYYLDSVAVEERAVSSKDIIDAIANRSSMMFLVGFYESTDDIHFTRKGGHFISFTATGVSEKNPKQLSVWIVDPANPGNEKSSSENPFNGKVQLIERAEGTDLDPLITSEIVDSKIETSGYHLLIESAIRLSLTNE